MYNNRYYILVAIVLRCTTLTCMSLEKWCQLCIVLYLWSLKGPLGENASCCCCSDCSASRHTVSSREPGTKRERNRRVTFDASRMPLSRALLQISFINRGKYPQTQAAKVMIGIKYALTINLRSYGCGRSLRRPLLKKCFSELFSPSIFKVICFSLSKVLFS